MLRKAVTLLSQISDEFTVSLTIPNFEAKQTLAFFCSKSIQDPVARIQDVLYLNFAYFAAILD